MPAFDPFALALAALAVDAVVGDPPALYRRVPHPVAVLGKWIAVLEGRLNDAAASDGQRLVRGGAAAFLVILTAAAGGALLHAFASVMPGGSLIEAIAASVLVAYRGLRDHVREVARGLEIGIAEARAAVAHIVGRDPASLDHAAVARAAIESTAENFADGVVAPLFWYVLLGLPGLLGYKAINTLDSMIGHRDPRHLRFGRIAARVDDAANWIPARLAAVLLAGGALVVPGARAGTAVRAAVRDAGCHRSVNAGWPEAAMAGALGFALAGPRRYGGRTVDDAWMGDGRRDLGAEDVRAALRLYAAATALLAALLAGGLGHVLDGGVSTRQSGSKLDAFLGLHAGPEMVLDHRHLGDRVGDPDQLGLGVAPGHHDVQRRRLGGEECADLV